MSDKKKEDRRFIATLISRRDFMKLSGGSMAALALAGCAPSSGGTAPSAADSTSASTGAATGIRTGGDIVWGSAITEAALLQLDPSIHASYTTGILSVQIADPLIWQYNPNDFRPGLAKSWEISPNWDEFTLHLRDDVVFHDGTPLNAEAVKAHFDRIVDPNAASLQAAALATYDHSEVVADHTVKVMLKSKTPLFMDTLSNQRPSSPEGWARYGDQWGINVKATGPFRIRDWRDAATVIFERNPDYNWAPEFADHQGPSYLDSVTFRSITDESTRLIALETGEIDIMDELPMEQYPRLLADPEFVLKAHPIGGLPQVLNINIESPPTNSLVVRQAMIMAVDVKTMVDLLFFGAFTPASVGPFGEGSWAYWPGVEEYYPYDPEKAKQLLEEAGWRDTDGDGIREAHGVEGVADGTVLRIRHVTASDYRSVRPAEFVQAALREIGIDDVVEAMAYESSAKRYADNDYEMARLGWSAFDPGSTARLFHSDSIETGGRFNRRRLRDPEIDALIEQAESEVDPKVRMDLYQEFQRRIAEMALHIPIYNQVRYRVYRPYLQGYFVPPVYETPLLHQMWRAE